MNSLLESLQKAFPENTTTNIEPVKSPKVFEEPEDEQYDDKLDEIYNRIMEATYKDFKNDSSTNDKSKINNHISNINRLLGDVEQMLSHVGKLKSETGSDQRVFWKGTLSKFQKIDQRLNRINTKIRELNS